MGPRSAMTRWYVRTHKKMAKRTMTQFVMRSQLCTQVAFWRFKWLAAPGKKKNRYFAKNMEQIVDFVEVIEHRQKARLVRNAWFNIKMSSERKKLISVWKNLSKFQSIINSNATKNVFQLKSDSEILSNSKICGKIVQAVLGKYQAALIRLQGNRLQCMMEERLSKETLSKLCERLCKMAEGSLHGLKHCG